MRWAALEFGVADEGGLSSSSVAARFKSPAQRISTLRKYEFGTSKLVTCRNDSIFWADVESLRMVFLL